MGDSAGSDCWIDSQEERLSSFLCAFFRPFPGWLEWAPIVSVLAARKLLFIISPCRSATTILAHQDASERGVP